MVIVMSKTKSDQGGERVTPKHIYSNPFAPHICPILALGLYFFSCPNVVASDVEEDASLLFKGSTYEYILTTLEYMMSLNK